MRKLTHRFMVVPAIVALSLMPSTGSAVASQSFPGHKYTASGGAECLTAYRENTSYSLEWAEACEVGVTVRDENTYRMYNYSGIVEGKFPVGIYPMRDSDLKLEPGVDFKRINESNILSVGIQFDKKIKNAGYAHLELRTSSPNRRLAVAEGPLYEAYTWIPFEEKNGFEIALRDGTWKQLYPYPH